MSDRRSFLRGLTTLPLIGGGVTLLGQPTRVARAASNEEIAYYAAFAFMEAMEATRRFHADGRLELFGKAMDQHRTSFPSNESIAFRAPIMLAAAGLPSLRGGWNV